MWQDAALLYVGIARQDPSRTSNPKARVVAGRLATYRACRLTQDFTVAAAFRFVVPHLDDAERRALQSGTIGVREIQRRTRSAVWRLVSVSAVAADPIVAAAAERHVKRYGLPGGSPPLFNPSP